MHTHFKHIYIFQATMLQATIHRPQYSRGAHYPEHNILYQPTFRIHHQFQLIIIVLHGIYFSVCVYSALCHHFSCGTLCVTVYHTFSPASSLQCNKLSFFGWRKKRKKRRRSFNERSTQRILHNGAHYTICDA